MYYSNLAVDASLYIVMTRDLNSITSPQLSTNCTKDDHARNCQKTSHVSTDRALILYCDLSISLNSRHSTVAVTEQLVGDGQLSEETTASYC